MALAFLEKWLHLCPPSRVAELGTFCIMLRNGIAQFVGSWVSESGYHLRIKKVRKAGPQWTSLIRAVLPFSVPTWGVRPH